MSYIDTFDNEFVGFFRGIPIYHPLEIVPSLPNEYPICFACGPENLVIGGGPGEHPGIVVHLPEQVVICFILAWWRLHQLQKLNEDVSLPPDIAAWLTALNGETSRKDWGQVFKFAGWKAADYVNFHHRCTSQAFLRPYIPDEDESLEQWLAESVGEFIYFAMPELAPVVIQQIGDLRRHVCGDMYRNILLSPPGYPVWGRREEEQNLIWGVSAWRIHREQNPQTIRDYQD